MSQSHVNDVGELAATLNETSIGGVVENLDKDAKSVDNRADLDNVEKWVEPQKYDYDSFNKKPDGEAGVSDTDQSSAVNAARYEWKDEYGDVPPPDPEVEKKLFKSELAIRHGENFSQLLMEVTQESSDQVEPIKKASLHLVSLLPAFTNLSEVPRRWSPPGHAGYDYSFV